MFTVLDDQANVYTHKLSTACILQKGCYSDAQKLMFLMYFAEKLYPRNIPAIR